MKSNAIVRIILFSLTIVILSCILIAGLSFNPFQFFHTIRAADNSNESVNSRQDSNAFTWENNSNTSPMIEIPSQISTNIFEIEIEWAAGSITIQSGDVDSIQIKDSGSDPGYETVIEEDDNSLSIEFCDDDKLFPGFHLGKTIQKDLFITLPKDFNLQELSLDVASAQVIVKNMTIYEVDFDGASGECTFENCTVNLLNVDTASGDIYFEGTLISLDFDAASASFCGDLTNVPSRLNIDSASGDLDITLPQHAGFILNLDAMNSDFITDFPTTSKNGSYICGDGTCQIRVSCMSGNVSIHQCHNESHTSCHGNHHNATSHKS